MHGYWNNGFNHMMNFGSRASGWFIVYDIAKLLIIVGLVIFISRMFVKNSRNNNNSNRAIEILKERYASGEISEEEYKKRLEKLNE